MARCPLKQRGAGYAVHGASAEGRMGVAARRMIPRRLSGPIVYNEGGHDPALASRGGKAVALDAHGKGEAGPHRRRRTQIVLGLARR